MRSIRQAVDLARALTGAALISAAAIVLYAQSPASIAPVSISTSSGVVNESQISLSNNTTNDCTTAKHGFAPKAPNSLQKFLDGTCAWSAPTVTLLGNASGNAAPGGAADLATVAISGLNAQDALDVLVEYFVQTGGEKLTITDTSTKIAEVDNNVALAASEQGLSTIVINARQDSLVNYHALTTEGSTTIGATTVFVSSNPATAFTGAWTLALHTSALDASIKYRLRVYRRIGQ